MTEDEGVTFEDAEITVEKIDGEDFPGIPTTDDEGSEKEYWGDEDHLRSVAEESIEYAKSALDDNSLVSAFRELGEAQQAVDQLTDLRREKGKDVR